MSYLLRVSIPDAPGSLGQLAAALGKVGGDIRSVDVVSHEAGHQCVVDDVVVELPPAALPDTLITAAHSLSGVTVDSIRPFSGSVNRSGQIQLLSSVAQAQGRRAAMQTLVDGLPRTMSASWAIVLSGQESVTRMAGSSAAPEDNDETLPGPPVENPCRLDPDDDQWVPQSWFALDSALAATPLGTRGDILIIGRTGGPDFLASEVDNLGKMGSIVSAVVGKN